MTVKFHKLSYYDDDDVWSLDEISLTLSVGSHAEEGVIIVRGSATAGSEASLPWMRAQATDR